MVKKGAAIVAVDVVVAAVLEIGSPTVVRALVRIFSMNPARLNQPP